MVPSLASRTSRLGAVILDTEEAEIDCEADMHRCLTIFIVQKLALKKVLVESTFYTEFNKILL